MTRGIWALWERTLRFDARHVGHHVQRCLIIALIYACLVILLSDARRFGAPGLRFFTGIAYLNAVLIIFLGVRSFSSVLTEEKEDGTLGLMMLTALSPLAILLGKSTSRLLQSLLLLAVQLPLALLAVTLGGVMIEQIVAAVVAIAAFVICLAQVGLLASVIARRTGDATGFTTIWAIAYGVLPALAVQMANQIQRFPGRYLPDVIEPSMIAGLRFLGRQSVFYRLSEILQSGFAGSPWCEQVGTNLLFALTCFGLAWWLFPLANRNPALEPPPRRLVTAAATKTPSAWRTAGRCWSNAPAWLAFQFDAAGVPGVVAKFVVSVAACLFVTWLQTEEFRRQPQRYEVFAGWAGTLTLLLYVELIVQAGRIFQNEYKAGTWSTLLTLPRSIAYLGYSKAGGALLSMVPVAFLCSLCWLMAIRRFRDLAQTFTAPGFWTFILFAVWLVNYIAWLSTYRHQLQATIRLMITATMGVGSVILLQVISERYRTDMWDSWGFFLIDAVLLVTMVAMHWSMGRQLARDDAS